MQYTTDVNVGLQCETCKVRVAGKLLEISRGYYQSLERICGLFDWGEPYTVPTIIMSE